MVHEYTVEIVDGSKLAKLSVVVGTSCRSIRRGATSKDVDQSSES